MEEARTLVLAARDRREMTRRESSLLQPRHERMSASLRAMIPY